MPDRNPSYFLIARFLILVAASVILVMGQTTPAFAQEAPGTPAQKLSKASRLEQGYGAVIISVRSEIYLVARMYLFFIREGGDPSRDEDVVRFSRKQPRLTFGNTTAKYLPVAMQLPEGRYRLAGHGAKCPKVPEPDERCIADIRFAGIGETVSFPSRGYGEDAPVIEVREGEVTYAGDFALTARNTIEWSAIPIEKMRRAMRKVKTLPKGPEPQVAEAFRLKYPLHPRSMSDDRGRRY